MQKQERFKRRIRLPIASRVFDMIRACFEYLQEPFGAPREPFQPPPKKVIERHQFPGETIILLNSCPLSERSKGNPKGGLIQQPSAMALAQHSVRRRPASPSRTSRHRCKGTTSKEGLE